jgi:hypothetical protein
LAGDLRVLRHELDPPDDDAYYLVTTVASGEQSDRADIAEALARRAAP